MNGTNSTVFSMTHIYAIFIIKMHLLQIPQLLEQRIIRCIPASHSPGSSWEHITCPSRQVFFILLDTVVGTGVVVFAKNINRFLEIGTRGGLQNTLMTRTHIRKQNKTGTSNIYSYFYSLTLWCIEMYKLLVYHQIILSQLSLFYKSLFMILHCL